MATLSGSFQRRNHSTDPLTDAINELFVGVQKQSGWDAFVQRKGPNFDRIQYNAIGAGVGIMGSDIWDLGAGSRLLPTPGTLESQTRFSSHASQVRASEHIATLAEDFIVQLQSRLEDVLMAAFEANSRRLMHVMEHPRKRKALFDPGLLFIDSSQDSDLVWAVNEEDADKVLLCYEAEDPIICTEWMSQVDAHKHMLLRMRFLFAILDNETIQAYRLSR
jgi:hypothetical protein